MIRTTHTSKRFTQTFVLACSIALTLSCNKEKLHEHEGHCTEHDSNTAQINGSAVSKTMTIVQIRAEKNGESLVMFAENPQVFSVSNTEILSQLRTSVTGGQKVDVKFNPWTSNILEAKASKQFVSKTSVSTKGHAEKIDSRASDLSALDVPERIGSINTTGPGLTNVIPDMATAQAMFNYITQQCCAIGGPYEVDYCISFQYAQDGCYARAHKMCYILNNTFKYETHKIFSFANAGGDVLSVQAQKWGGCCVNWWYHVAPLVNIKTPSGVKAYVFDPAMFNQPVLLSEWLHGQENPACVGWGFPNVSMINLQPTEMYAPSDYSGYAFMTDPSYFDTNSTLSSYSTLTTCP